MAKLAKKKTLRPSMTKSEILSEMAALMGVTKPVVSDFFNALVEIAYDEAANSERGFAIPGLGKLIVIDRKARMGRNPATGETIKIPAKKAVKFRVSKACKEAILG